MSAVQRALGQAVRAGGVNTGVDVSTRPTRPTRPTVFVVQLLWGRALSYTLRLQKQYILREPSHGDGTRTTNEMSAPKKER